MEFNVKSGSPEKQRSACIIVGVFEPRRLSPIAEQLDKISDGYISALLRRGELEGKVGQSLLLHHVPNVLSERVLLIGCGKERELDERQYKQIIQKPLTRSMKLAQWKRFAFSLSCMLKVVITTGKYVKRLRLQKTASIPLIN